jgi:carbonic anhydrase
MSNEGLELSRGAFLAGSLAAMSAALPESALAAAPGGSAGPGSASSAERLLGELMAGNKRFVSNDFPPMNNLEQKRELLETTQAPFAAILGCSDSRVVPNLVFVQGIGDLFVARVAGNYPDDLVIASIEYAIEHLGTRLVMVLGHQNCGAVKAVYSAIKTNVPLPTHLSTIQRLIEPGIGSVVKARGSEMEAIEANTRAAVAKLKATPPYLAASVESGHVLVTGGVYLLHTGEVKLLD